MDSPESLSAWFGIGGANREYYPTPARRSSRNIPNGTARRLKPDQQSLRRRRITPACGPADAKHQARPAAPGRSGWMRSMPGADRMAHREIRGPRERQYKIEAGGRISDRRLEASRGSAPWPSARRQN